MATSFKVIIVFILFVLIAGYLKGGVETIKIGFKSGGTLFLQILPILICAFIIAGFIQVLIPKEIIAKFIGKASGLKGILIGTIIGFLTPAGPYFVFPLLVSFLKAGAVIGPILAYVTAWGTMGIQRLIIWELPFMGPRFVIARVTIAVFLPLLVGVLGNIVYTKLLKFL